MIGPYMAGWHEMILGTGLTDATGGYPLSRIDVIYSQQGQCQRHMKGLWEFSKGYGDYGPALGKWNVRICEQFQASRRQTCSFMNSGTSATHLKDTRPDLGPRYPWQRIVLHQEEMHAKRLKYLPVGYWQCKQRPRRTGNQ